MGSYRYRAVNESGAVVAGTLVADTVAEARARLRRQGLFPKRVERAAGGRSWRARLPGARLRAAMQVAVFTRQLAMLLAAGVPLAEALSVLVRQTEHPGLAAALSEVSEAVHDGSSLADALAAHPNLFDRAYVGMVAAGEKTGTMDHVAARLADYLERQRLLLARLSTALIYPALLAAMVLGLLFFLSAWVVPMIAPLLREGGGPLPLTTTVLFAVGDFVRLYGWVALLAAALLVATLLRLRHTARGRRLWDAAVLRVPLVGPMVRKGLISGFAVSFAALLRTGVPVVEALDTLRVQMSNAVFAAELARLREHILAGKDFSAAMSAGKGFPPMVAYMVAVGERSGSLADVLDHLAKVYDFELEVASRRLLAVLEPAIVLVMAGVVGFIALSLVVTILQLSRI